MDLRGISLYLKVSVALLLLLALFTKPVNAQLHTIRVGLYENEPKIFTDQNGKPAGFFVDLLDRISVEENWTIEYVPCEWDECLYLLEHGEIDLLPDVAYTAERDLVFDFHEIPVIESWSRVYASPQVPASQNSLIWMANVLRYWSGSIQESAFQGLMDGFGYKVTIIPANPLKKRSLWQPKGMPMPQ